MIKLIRFKIVKSKAVMTAHKGGSEGQRGALGVIIYVNTSRVGCRWLFIPQVWVGGCLYLKCGLVVVYTSSVGWWLFIPQVWVGGC